jgi:hypothetical protein
VQNLPLLCTFCPAIDDGESFGAEQGDIRRWPMALNRGGMSVDPKSCGVWGQEMDGDYRVAKKVSVKEARRTEPHVWPDCGLEVVDEQVDGRVACRSSFDACLVSLNLWPFSLAPSWRWAGRSISRSGCLACEREACSHTEKGERY